MNSSDVMSWKPLPKFKVRFADDGCFLDFRMAQERFLYFCRKDILSAGKFQVPQTQEFESAMNQEFEKIKAGF